MILKVATTFAEIMEGWRLVYHRYVKSALIDANPFSIFTYPEYVSGNSAVILGKEGGKSVCSVSAVLDSNHGLPLDAYFHEELDELRKNKKKLIEIGLLANKSETASPFYIIELLSSVARFGVYSDFHDYVIGVHPRRAKFLQHLFGLHQIGVSKKYNKLHAAEVILLHADGKDFETLALKAMHAVYFDETDLKFENRFKFVRIASLKPFIVINRLISFFKKLWKRFFHIKKKIEKPAVLLFLLIKKMITSKVFKKSESNRAIELKFQSVDSMFIEPDVRPGKERSDVMTKKLQTAFGMSKVDLSALIDKEEPFNHQY